MSSRARLANKPPRTVTGERTLCLGEVSTVFGRRSSDGLASVSGNDQGGVKPPYTCFGLRDTAKLFVEPLSLK